MANKTNTLQEIETTTFDAEWYVDMLRKLSKAQLVALMFNICKDINSYASGCPSGIQRTLDEIIGPDNLIKHNGNYTMNVDSEEDFKTESGKDLETILEEIPNVNRDYLPDFISRMLHLIFD